MKSSWNSPAQNTGVGSLSQWIFPNQGSKTGLPHCGQILYQLSHKKSPWILEQGAYPFSRGSSWPRKTNWGLLHWRQFLYQLSYQGSLIEKHHKEKSNGIRKRSIFILIQLIFKSFSEFENNKVLTLLSIISDTNQKPWSMRVTISLHIKQGLT